MSASQIFDQVCQLPVEEQFYIVQRVLAHLSVSVREKTEAERKRAHKKLMQHLSKSTYKLPKNFKFDREEANARR